MPIDPRIPLGVQPAQFNLGDMMSGMATMQNIRANQMQMRHYALQAEKQDQAQRGDTALRNAIQQFTKDDGTVGWDEAIDHLNGTGFGPEGLALGQHVVKQREDLAKSVEAEAKATGAQFALAAQAFQGVKDGPSLKRAIAAVSKFPSVAPIAQQFFGDGTFGPDTPEKVKQAVSFGQSVKEYADVQNDLATRAQEALRIGNSTEELRLKQLKEFREIATTGFRAAPNQEAWQAVQNFIGQVAGKMAPQILPMFDAQWSPESQARAEKVGISPEKGAELALQAAGQKETRRNHLVTEGLSAAAGKREQERLDLTYGVGVGKEGTPENATAKAIAEYRMPPISARSMASGPGRALMDQVMALNPTYDGTQFPARNKMRTAFTSGPQGQTLNSLNTAIEHLDQFADAAKELGNGSFKPGNAAYNWLRENFGDTAPTNFTGIKTIMAGELAAAFKKSGATDQEIKEVQHSIDKSNSTAQLVEYATKVAIPALGSKANAFREQFQSVMGDKDPAAAQLLSPSARKVLAKHGYDPDHPLGGAKPAGDAGGKEETVEQNGHKYRIKRDASGNVLSATPVP